MGRQIPDLTGFSGANRFPLRDLKAGRFLAENAPELPAKKLKKFASGLNVRRPFRDR